MIDLHFHCLPGIDDGPQGWDEAVGLCRAAAADGVTRIVATPHVLRDRWVNDDRIARDTLVTRLNELLGGEPQVFPGCEYYFSSDALELWEQGEAGPLTGLNRSRYLLLEFPATRIPDRAESVVYEMSLAGVTAVIAHPERNLVFAEQPARLQRFIEIGAIAQVTASSITGAFGRAAYSATEEFFRRELIHLVASDSHSLDRRPPSMSSAREAVRERWGSDAESILFDLTPSAIFNDEPYEL
ncbi:MAG: tyrosine-protein phosphatase [Thermoanaerobaculia bacterium]